MSHAAHAEESLRGPERNGVSRRGAGTLGQDKESTAVSLSAPPRLCASRFSYGLRPGRLGGRDSRETKPIGIGIGSQGSGVSNLTPDTRPLTPGLLCETNPIGRVRKWLLTVDRNKA
jgi:hypothetical protein